jgi:DNA-binding response OmpR family regulator
MNVLIVEDDPNLSILWEDVFEQSGHSTVSVNTAGAARDALGAGAFDLVVLDFYLGDGNGGDVASSLGGGTPVLIVTGAAANCNGELFDISSAVAGVLRKPVDIEDLIEVSEFLAHGDGPMAEDRRARLALELRGSATSVF